MADPRTARILLETLIRELPADAELNLRVHRLSRPDYDALPGELEVYVGGSKEWTKDIYADGLLVELFTNEPPPLLKAVYPVGGRGDLHLIKGGAA